MCKRATGLLARAAWRASATSERSGSSGTGRDCTHRYRVLDSPGPRGHAQLKSYVQSRQREGADRRPRSPTIPLPPKTAPDPVRRPFVIPGVNSMKETGSP